MNDPLPPMDVSITTKLTIDDRYFGGNVEFQETFVDKVAYVQGVAETMNFPGEVTVTFSDTLPGDAKKRMARFMRGLNK